MDKLGQNYSIVHDILSSSISNKCDIETASQIIDPAFLKHEALIKKAIKNDPEIMKHSGGVCAYPGGWPA